MVISSAFTLATFILVVVAHVSIHETSYFQTFGLRVSVKFRLVLGFRHRVYLLHLVCLYQAYRILVMHYCQIAEGSQISFQF